MAKKDNNLCRILEICSVLVFTFISVVEVYNFAFIDDTSVKSISIVDILSCKGCSKETDKYWQDKADTSNITMFSTSEINFKMY